MLLWFIVCIKCCIFVDCKVNDFVTCNNNIYKCINQVL